MEELYIRHIVWGERIFDKQLFMELCVKADDVWLKFMQMIKRTPVVFVRGKWVYP